MGDDLVAARRLDADAIEMRGVGTRLVTSAEPCALVDGLHICSAWDDVPVPPKSLRCGRPTPRVSCLRRRSRLPKKRSTASEAGSPRSARTGWPPGAGSRLAARLGES
jgi:hypothetical protein